MAAAPGGARAPLLTDTGPLIALVDADDPSHPACREVVTAQGDALVTSQACLTEALHILDRLGGWKAQRALCTWVRDGPVRVLELDGEAFQRALELMDAYRTVPMDFADATLVALAERHALRRIFTLDGHFRVYRARGQGQLELLPAPPSV